MAHGGGLRQSPNCPSASMTVAEYRKLKGLPVAPMAISQPQPARATIPRRGRMNKTEALFSAILESERRHGIVRRWEFEAITVRLADGARYTPDFFIVMADGTIEIVETKGGFIRDAAMIRFKVARDRFPEFVWKMWQHKKGQWKQLL